MKKKSMLDHSKSMRFGAVHSRGADVFFLILLWVEKNCFRNWSAHGDQTAAEDPSKKCGAQTSKSGVADLAVEGLLFVKVSTKLDIHSLLTGSAAGPLAWSEIDPAHRAFDARGPTKPNFQRPDRHDRAGQRCKCRLVCEWVCTVTSVSVRIEKRCVNLVVLRFVEFRGCWFCGKTFKFIICLSFERGGLDRDVLATLDEENLVQAAFD